MPSSPRHQAGTSSRASVDTAEEGVRPVRIQTGCPGLVWFWGRTPKACGQWESSATLWWTQVCNVKQAKPPGALHLAQPS